MSLLHQPRDATDVLRGERIGWVLAKTGYAVLAAGIILAALLLIGADTDAPMVNGVFLTLVFQGILVSVLGSTALGVALLRAGYQPRTTAWLLALAIPGFVLGSLVLGHNSLGLVPLFLAWACTAWAADTTATDTEAVLTEPVRGDRSPATTTATHTAAAAPRCAVGHRPSSLGRSNGGVPNGSSPSRRLGTRPRTPLPEGIPPDGVPSRR